MNGTWITDAELKDILLTLAKYGASKPRDGTALGDALARFIVQSAENRMASNKGGRSKLFGVGATVTKELGIGVLVHADSGHEAAALVEQFASQEDLRHPDARWIKTPTGVREVDLRVVSDVDIAVTITSVEVKRA